jgi:uncharacterized protein (TIGR02996 family)
MTTRDALEAALAARPADAALHAAYADLLIEAGDPRGEYIRLQLAAEAPDQPPDRLRELEQRAFDLRREHEADWLGPLHPFVNPSRGPAVGDMVAEAVEVTWRRGWLFSVEVPTLTRELAAAVSACPAARVLQRLRVRRGAIGRLKTAPYVRSLRRLDTGTRTPEDDEYDAGDFVRRARRLRRLSVAGCILTDISRVFQHATPRLRELTVETFARIPVGVLGYCKQLARLRRLRLDNSIPHPDPGFPRVRTNPPDEVAILFRAGHLGRLRHLTLRLREFGDGGVDELIRSGLIARLRGLDLCRCDITDDGALALAACPDVPRLEYLHLDHNHLSGAGIDALAAVGVTVSRRQTFTPWDDDEIDYV